MIKKIIEKLQKPLTLEYANKFLRSKGIATSEQGEHHLAFKLYDMNWLLNCEGGRFGLRNSFNLGSDINMNCLLQAANRLNTDRWIVKAFVETYTPKNDEDTPNENKSISSIIFSFESFCYSESSFEQMYEFAIYAMTDGIEYHKKCYNQLLEENNALSLKTRIGFHADGETQEKSSVTENNHQRNRIGFIQYNTK